MTFFQIEKGIFFEHRGCGQLLPEQLGQRVPAHQQSKQLNPLPQNWNSRESGWQQREYSAQKVSSGLLPTQFLWNRKGRVNYTFQYITKIESLKPRQANTPYISRLQLRHLKESRKAILQQGEEAFKIHIRIQAKGKPHVKSTKKEQYGKSSE